MKREQGRGAAAAEMLPPLVDLGTFAAERENTFVLPVSEAVQAWTEIDGMAVRTEVSAAGEHILRLTLPAMRTGVLLYGALILRGPQGERTVHLTGRAAEGAQEHCGAPVGSALPALVRGERLVVEADETIGFFYEDMGHAAGVDVDAYVFRLYADGRVRGDADLVFFGNPIADDGSIRVEKGARIGAVVNVAALAAEAARLVICFSVYEDGAGRDFSHVRSPLVTLSAGGVTQYRFPLDALRREKTVNAAELYRYRGAWKLRLVGAGYEAGLARLCEDYGLSVE